MSQGVLPLPTQPTPVAPLQGTLALEITPHDAPPEIETAPPPRRPADARRHEVEQWCRRFVQAVVEIVGGDRPASQLVRWTSEEVYADLERRARVVGSAGGFRPGLRRVQQVHPKVVRVHAQMLSDEVTETCAHVRYGARSRAVAARFELTRSRRDLKPRWVCTALELA